MKFLLALLFLGTLAAAADACPGHQRRVQRREARHAAVVTTTSSVKVTATSSTSFKGCGTGGCALPSVGKPPIPVPPK